MNEQLLVCKIARCNNFVKGTDLYCRSHNSFNTHSERSLRRSAWKEKNQIMADLRNLGVTDEPLLINLAAYFSREQQHSFNAGCQVTKQRLQEGKK